MGTENAEEQLFNLLKLPEGEKPDESGPQYSIYRSTKSRRPDQGHFCWIWMFGQRIPSIVVNNEPWIPFEEILAVLSDCPTYDRIAFQDILKVRSIYLPLATRKQVDMLRTQSPSCHQYNPINLQLISRSDIERVLGEFRMESFKSDAAESDYWNNEERFVVSHYNFVDYNDDMFLNDDPDADIYESGTCGWYYPSRSGYRCIVCCSCSARFTPNDFSVHFHSRRGDETIRHHGLNSNNWAKTIRPYGGAKAKKEHIEIWRQFVTTGTVVLRRKRTTEPLDKVSSVMVKRLALVDPDQPCSSKMVGNEVLKVPVAVKFDATLQRLSLCLLACSQKTRDELQALTRKLQETHFTPNKIPNPNDAWSAVLKEQSLLKELSDEAIQVLDGKFNPFAVKFTAPPALSSFPESAFKVPKKSKSTNKSGSNTDFSLAKLLSGAKN